MILQDAQLVQIADIPGALERIAAVALLVAAKDPQLAYPLNGYQAADVIRQARDYGYFPSVVPDRSLAVAEKEAPMTLEFGMVVDLVKALRDGGAAHRPVATGDGHGDRLDRRKFPNGTGVGWVYVHRTIAAHFGWSEKDSEAAARELLDVGILRHVGTIPSGGCGPAWEMYAV
jgi:hypothetical protein